MQRRKFLVQPPTHIVVQPPTRTRGDRVVACCRACLTKASHHALQNCTILYVGKEGGGDRVVTYCRACLPKPSYQQCIGGPDDVIGSRVVMSKFQHASIHINVRNAVSRKSNAFKCGGGGGQVECVCMLHNIGMPYDSGIT